VTSDQPQPGSFLNEREEPGNEVEVITGAKSYSKSLHNQKGNSSGPELVRFRFNKNLCTVYSGMTEIGVPSGIET
jgi:hypothetical protein